ncbi:MAG: class I SAM-dependent methyltransferase [Nitrospinae bacterium]|nr:class I SAM-dependent methyltransferase [Nitrospinota bacterium]
MKCFACDAESQITNGLFKCNECDLTLSLADSIWESDDSETIFFDEEDHNDLFKVEDSSFWFRNRNKVILKVLKKFCPSGNLWDIGGGNGYVTKFLQEAGYPAILIEPSSQAIQNAKRRKVKNIIKGSLYSINVKPESIKNCALFDVLEHFDKPEIMIQKISLLLPPSGKLYITVPAHNLLWSQIDEYSYHYNRFNRKTLNKLLNAHGFKEIYSSYFFSFLFIPMLILRVLPYKIFSRKKRKDLFDREVKKHNKFAETIIKRICRVERKVLEFTRLPLGTSLIAVYEKVDTQ